MAPAPPNADFAPYATAHRIATARHDSDRLTLEWSDGQRSRFDALWLRENCACPQCRHPQALERTYAFVDHPSPALESCRVDDRGDLEICFRQDADRHQAHFTRGWLRYHDPSESSRRIGELRARPWGTDIAARLTRVSYTDYMAGRDGLRTWIRGIKIDGIALLHDVPRVSGQLLEVARRIGPVRGSNFGEYYDVVSQPNPNASAYTAMGLELHTDLANWRSPPDIQLLCCLASSVAGGESVFADGFQVAEGLRQTDPAAFDLLASQPIEFRFHDEHCDIRTSAPVIEVARDGALQRIRFNNWLRGAMIVPESLVGSIYRALGQFWRMLRDPRHQLHRRLAPGDLIAYDNKRVLHGRAPFDPSSGKRHLQGCYLNEEDLDSTLRLIERAAE